MALLTVCMTTALGQGHRSQVKRYRGLEVSFGRRSFQSESNFSQINRDIVSVDGGQAGIIFGNKIFRGELGLIGYYSSISNVAGTIDLYTNHATVRFYPMSLGAKSSQRLEPYVNAGFSYDRFKFYGHYALKDESNKNYSGPEPFLGSIKQVNTSVGIGLEFKIIDQYDFVHLFTEMRWYKAMNNSSSSSFDNTQLSANTVINIGLSFGYNR